MLQMVDVTLHYSVPWCHSTKLPSFSYISDGCQKESHGCRSGRAAYHFKHFKQWAWATKRNLVSQTITEDKRIIRLFSVIVLFPFIPVTCLRRYRSSKSELEKMRLPFPSNSVWRPSHGQFFRFFGWPASPELLHDPKVAQSICSSGSERHNHLKCLHVLKHHHSPFN